jgi:hypothetical protein
MNCKICRRPIEKERYCNLHLKAYQNICKKFELWKNAFEVSWIDYLVYISKNSLTGEWAKEVAKHLIEDESRNVKEK